MDSRSKTGAHFTEEQWARIRELEEFCGSLMPAERLPFVEARTDIDEDVRAELKALLTAKLEREEPKPFQQGSFWCFKSLGEQVYLAKKTMPTGLGPFVALKEIPCPRLENRSTFEHKVKASVRLNHANILHTLELNKTDDAYLVSMEAVRGKDLAQLMKRLGEQGYALPPDLAVYVAAKLASAVHQAQTAIDTSTKKAFGMIHPSFKPNNVLISYNGEVKLFGFCTAQSQTSAYMSPEEARGQAVDVRSNIFSICVILYEMLTGNRLFDGSDEESLRQQIGEGSLPEAILPQLGLPEKLLQILAHGLANLPEERFQTAADLSKDLAGYLVEHSSTFADADVRAFIQEWFAEEFHFETEQWSTLDKGRPDIPIVEDEPQPESPVQGLPLPKVAFKLKAPTPPPPTPEEDEEPKTDWAGILRPVAQLGAVLLVLIGGFQLMQPKISPDTEEPGAAQAEERQTNAAGTQEDKGACMTDLMKFCSDRNGQDQMKACLIEHVNELTDRCQKKVRGYIAAAETSPAPSVDPNAPPTPASLGSTETQTPIQTGTNSGTSTETGTQTATDIQP